MIFLRTLNFELISIYNRRNELRNALTGWTIFVLKYFTRNFALKRLIGLLRN
jgi:hypothetical protein